MSVESILKWRDERWGEQSALERTDLPGDHAHHGIAPVVINGLTVSVIVEGKNSHIVTLSLEKTKTLKLTTLERPRRLGDGRSKSTG